MDLMFQRMCHWSQWTAPSASSCIPGRPTRRGAFTLRQPSLRCTTKSTTRIPSGEMGLRALRSDLVRGELNSSYRVRSRPSVTDCWVGSRVTIAAVATVFGRALATPLPEISLPTPAMRNHCALNSCLTSVHSLGDLSLQLGSLQPNTGGSADTSLRSLKLWWESGLIGSPNSLQKSAENFITNIRKRNRLSRLPR